MSHNIIQLENFPLLPARSTAQRDLFGYSERNSGAFVVVSEGHLNQEKLEKVVRRKNIRLIVDMRLFPAFRSPAFHPNRTVEFLKANRVSYFDFSKIVRDLEKGRSTDLKEIGVRKIIELRKNSLHGLCLVIVDDKRTTTLGRLLRGFLSEIKSNIVEMNPRSLR
jgi:hypothetical protein